MQLSKLIILLFILKSFILEGQDHHLYGKVIDENGLAMPGATIVTRDFRFSTVSDTDGTFEINSKEKICQEFSVSFIGYQTRHIHIEYPYPAEPLLIILQPYQQILDEITIRDDHLKRKLKENPLSMSVASEEFLARNKQGSLMKTLERLPGISAMEIGSGQSKPAIRGLGFNRVVVTENGIKHESQQWGSDHGLEIDQFGVEELEIIKGPVSLMYGSDAMAGVINIRSYSIPHKNSLGGNAQMQYSSNNGKFAGSFNFDARKTNWFFSARYSLTDYGDMRVPADTITVYSYKVALNNKTLTNTSGSENSFKFNFGYLGKKVHSAFYLSENLMTTGMFAHAHGLEPRRVDTTVHFASGRDALFPKQEVNHFKLINKTQYFWDENSTLLEFGYQKNIRNEYNDYISHGYMPSTIPETTDLSQNLERGFNKNTFSANIRQQFQIGTANELNFGFNTEFQNNQIDGYSFIIPSFRQTTGGFFLYDQHRISKKWILSGGLRYDLGIIRTEAYSDWFTTPVTEGTITTDEYLVRAPKIERSFCNWSGSAGVSYNHKDFTFKANTGKSYRMPTPKEIASNGVNYHHFSFEKGDSSLGAEISYQMDLNLEWHKPLWAFQLSPFINYFPNYIYLNPGFEMDIYYGAGNQVFNYRQSKVFRVGSELQAQLKLTKSLKLSTIAEYIFSRQLSGDKKGFALPFSPPGNVLLSLNYSAPSYKWIKEPYLGIDFHWTAPQNDILPTEQKTPGYSVWNLHAGSRLLIGKQLIQLNLIISNIWNTKYLNHTNFYRLISLPEPGRNITFSINIPFHKSLNIS